MYQQHVQQKKRERWIDGPAARRAATQRTCSMKVTASLSVSAILVRTITTGSRRLSMTLDVGWWCGVSC